MIQLRILGAALLVGVSAQTEANIDIQFDYSYDSSGFLSDGNRRSALDAAANLFERRFSDQLTAIDSAGSNSFDTVFFNPGDPYGANVVRTDASFGTNVIRVYAGGYNYSDNTLGEGGPGGYNCSGSGSFCSDAIQRGQGPVNGGSAVDVAPWGGSIVFDTDTSWHFGTTTSGLDTSEYDFYSVAVHELAHVLGFATSDAFDNRIVGTDFVGPAAGTVALDEDLDHWADGTLTTYRGSTEEAAMTGTLASGTRKHFTELDFAAMQDIGWRVTPVPEASTWAMLLSGLALVGGAARRRVPAD